MLETITIAMAKGRIANGAISLLENAGILFPEFIKIAGNSSSTDENKNIKLIFVKAVDVPTYVELGAADIGIIGKDVMLEDPKDVYEMLDLASGNANFRLRDSRVSVWIEHS